MTIRTIQTCNRCGKERELKPTILSAELKSIAQHGGWRELTDKHLCPDCIAAIFEVSDVSDSESVGAAGSVGAAEHIPVLPVESVPQ
jgi:hypothetical protein